MFYLSFPFPREKKTSKKIGYANLFNLKLLKQKHEETFPHFVKRRKQVGIPSENEFGSKL